MADYYRDNILKVQVLIGRNLGAWLDNAPQSQSTVRLDNVHG
ncbi:MAG TPA: hypothetical protein VHK27_15245 [Gammaproteobacteria bacterium]|nr:hypothetical protein [Gammaproteobacteria bacterium]